MFITNCIQIFFFMQYPVANEVLDISSIRVTGAWCSHVYGFLIITHLYMTVLQGKNFF